MKINPKFIVTKHQVHFQPMRQSAKTADWLVGNDVIWPVLRNSACANPRKLKRSIKAWRLSVREGC